MSSASPVIPATARAEAALVQEKNLRGKTRRVKQRLTSRTATIVAIIIAVIWTIPTFGLFVSSFRPAADIRTTGWWTVFTNPSFSLENYEADGREHKRIAVDKALCKGCGICMATCPKRGVNVAGFTMDQLAAQIDTVLAGF